MRNLRLRVLKWSAGACAVKKYQSWVLNPQVEAPGPVLVCVLKEDLLCLTPSNLTHSKSQGRQPLVSALGGVPDYLYSEHWKHYDM